MPLLLESRLPRPVTRGKVRDVYDLGDRLLLLATDRISAYDVVLPNGVPDKGAVLTQLSAFWFERVAHIVPNHFLRVVDDEWLHSEGRETLGLESEAEAKGLARRSMLVKKAERIDIECVVRGYLAGSAWVEYRESGAVCGEALPPGLAESARLPRPIFTPATKAASGHDQNISISEMREIVGTRLADCLIETSLAVYLETEAYARARGLIIADTKMEFGLLDGQPILIDELLTPDSSRYWPASEYRVGASPPSFDKQFVRDYLNSIRWNREPPAPQLPPDVVEKTAEKYREAYRRITGREVRPA